jgi:hypothetical protein
MSWPNKPLRARRLSLRYKQQELIQARRAADLVRQKEELSCRRNPYPPSDTANNTPPNNNPSFRTTFLSGVPIIGGTLLAALLIPCRRGRNPSPGDPRGRNDECR